ncbi:MAG: YgjV family protein [Clostridia bacterium]|nr:YgjV family protein [Clostridia bacterium]
MDPNIIGQILGIFAPILTVVTYQMNTKKSLLIVLTSATVCTCLSYLLLGATSGFSLNIVCVLRNLCFYFQHEGSKANTVSALLLAAVMVIFGALSWQGPISLLIMIALAINTICMSLGNPQRLRKSILLTSSLVLIYNVVVFSIGGMINESLAIGSAIVGIIRFKQTK